MKFPVHAFLLPLVGLLASTAAVADSESYWLEATCTTPEKTYVAAGLVSEGPTQFTNGVRNDVLSVTTEGQTTTMKGVPVFTGLGFSGMLTIQNGGGVLSGALHCNHLVRVEEDSLGGQRPVVSGFQFGAASLAISAGGKGVLSENNAKLVVTLTLRPR